MRTVQYFSDEYLKNAREATTAQILQFLENYRNLQQATFTAPSKVKTKLISIRMPVDTLIALKKLAQKRGVPYQTLVKGILASQLK